MEKKIESLVCGLDQAKKIKALGVTEPALFRYYSPSQVGNACFAQDPDFVCLVSQRKQFVHSTIAAEEKKIEECSYPAYTSEELLDLIRNIDPFTKVCQASSIGEYVFKIQLLENGKEIIRRGKTEAIARAEVLILILENHQYLKNNVQENDKLIYFNALLAAPAEIPSWFAHKARPMPTPPKGLKEDDPFYEELTSWLKDPIYDLPEELAWFQEKWAKYEEDMAEWKRHNEADRYFQWKKYFATQIASS